MSGRLVLYGGRVCDGTGAAPAAADVLIRDGVIADVGSGLDADDGVDVSGHTILPGFIDGHVHLMFSGVDTMRMLHEPFSYPFYAAIGNMRRTLEAGVTTVRDAGGVDLGLKQALSDGLVEGPRVQMAITVLSQTGGHTDGWCVSGDRTHLFVEHPGRPAMVVDGTEQMRVRVRELVRAGADVIKICTSGGVLSPRSDPRFAQFSPEEIDVCVAEAAAGGLRVMAHAMSAAGVKNALRAGVRSIEHGIHLDDEAIELMLRDGSWLVPTLMAPRSIVEAGEHGAALSPGVLGKAAEACAAHASSFSHAVEAGVNIAMGTDSGVFPHGDNVNELDLMRECGMQPLDVIRASTSAAARRMGLDDLVGTVAPGKIADLVVVSGNPLEFGDLKERIVSVYREGVAVVDNTVREGVAA